MRAYKWVRYFALLLVGVGIINLAAVLVFKVVLARVRLEPPPIMRDLIFAGAYAVLAVSLLTRMGVNLTGIVATSAVVTAVIGFSLADTLGNIMGGMALQMVRSIVVGDWVRVGQHEGMLKEIRWRQTTIETRSWDTVIIPNSQLMKSDVTVLGRREGRPRQSRQAVVFNVDFRHSPTEVIDAVEGALRAEQISNVAAEPPPNCIVTEFRLDKDAFVDVLKKRPEVAEGIDRILSRRRAELDAVREGLNEQATRARSGEAVLLRRIKAFFTLD